MDFKGYMMKGVELLKLNGDAAFEVSKDENAFVPALLFFAIGGLAAGLGALFSGGGLSGIIVMLVFVVVASFVGVGVLHLFAKLLGGTGEFKGYYGSLGVGSLPLWAGMVPVLGFFVSLWFIPVSVVITRRVHKLSTGRAVAVVIVPLVIAVLMAFAAWTGMMAFMGMSGNMQGM